MDDDWGWLMMIDDDWWWLMRLKTKLKCESCDAAVSVPNILTDKTLYVLFQLSLEESAQSARNGKMSVIMIFQMHLSKNGVPHFQWVHHHFPRSCHTFWGVPSKSNVSWTQMISRWRCHGPTKKSWAVLRPNVSWNTNFLGFSWRRTQHGCRRWMDARVHVDIIYIFILFVNMLTYYLCISFVYTVVYHKLMFMNC